MLIEVDRKKYDGHFPNSEIPYLNSSFCELNKDKVDKIVRLIESENRTSIGLIAGIKDKILKSPFSAPFGGFHHRKDNQYISEIENFITNLIVYCQNSNINKIELTLPPDFYDLSFNSKLCNTLLRNEFALKIPNITNWVNLENFVFRFKNKSSRKLYNQAKNNELHFSHINDIAEKRTCYEIIHDNRVRFNRPIYMSFDDIIEVANLWPVDFFGVYSPNNNMVASGVFYRGSSSIVQGIFWGDNKEGRALRAIDFLSFNIWSFYKNLNYKIIDLGTSTEEGIPNEGLLRFKESHDCLSSLRLSFYKKIL